VTLATEEAAQPGWRPEPANRDRLLFSLANALRLPAAWPHALPLLATLAPRMEQAGLREEWLEYVERGIECCDASGDVQTAAHLVLERGVLLERLGRLTEAQASLADAVERFKICGDQRSTAKAHNRLAYVLRNRHAAIEAAEQVERAQALLVENDPEWLYCHLVRGMLARDRHDWATAVEHLLCCIEGWQNAEDRRLYGMSLINLGSVYIAMGEHTRAIECLTAAMPIVTELGDSHNTALIHLNMGGLYLFLCQPDSALSESLAAEVVYRQMQDEQRLALVYSNLGLAYGQLGRIQEAESSLEAAIQRFEALEDYPNFVDTLIDMGRLYLDSERRQQARGCAVQAQELLDRIPHAEVREYQRTKIEYLAYLIDQQSSDENESGQS
jgi:tetratricopeptide (TPR) repeat protein